jgi:xanthine dehydrogenase accessory factor
MDWLIGLNSLRTKNESGILVTLIGLSGSTPRELGAKMLIAQIGEVFGTIGGGQFEYQIIDEAKKLLVSTDIPKSFVTTKDFPLSVKTQQCCGGTVQVLFELIRPYQRLFIFGAGHVGAALARVLEGLPFQVHLIDERAEWIQSDKIPESTMRVAQNPVSFAKSDVFKASDAVAVMTHSHDLDFELIDILCDKNLSYLGLIGSDTKWSQLRSRLKHHTPENIQSVRCPIGFKIGGKTPPEVAISIAAELIQEFHSKADHELSSRHTVRW